MSFNLEYAVAYENFSSQKPSTYDEAAKQLVRAAGNIPQDAQCLEIGSGTGNSTVVLAGANPNANFVCIEPSSMIKLAAHKFGYQTLKLQTMGFSPEALTHVEEKQKVGVALKNNVLLIQGRVPHISLRDDSCDFIFCCQSFHWFGITKQGFDQKTLVQAVCEISRTLKPGGKLVFDTNGHIFNFGKDRWGKKLLNDIHFVKHPLFVAFDSNLNRWLTSQNAPQTDKQLNAGNPLAGSLNMPLLSQVLSENNLTILQPKTQRQYTLKVIPFPVERIKRSILDGTSMNRFDPLNISEKEKEKITRDILSKTISEDPELVNRPFYETIATFVAVKN